MNYAVIAASIKKTIIGRKTKSIIAALLLAASSAFAQGPQTDPGSIAGNPIFTSTVDEEIFNVSLGTLNNTSTCSSTAPGAGSFNSSYNNYTTSVPAPNLEVGNIYNGSITIGYCATGTFNNIARMWIDYNRNGLFTDPGETVYTKPYGVSALTGTAYPFTVTIPNYATPGLTRMRVVLIESSVAPTPTVIGTWGEGEDYLVNIISVVPSYVPTNGLVGWWPFNGNANDESGNGNNGTVNGATLTNDRFGNTGKAYNYDGVNDYIEINNNNLYSFMLNNSYTVNFWININSNSNMTQSFIGQGDGDGQYQNRFWRSYLSNSQINNHIRGNGSDPFDTKNTFTYSSTNTWTLITMVRNYNSNLQLYINGVLTDNDNDITGLSNQFTAQRNILIGAFLDANNNQLIQFLNGSLDDIGIWNRPLTQQEITALYNSSICIGNITADGPTTFCAGNSVTLTSDVLGGTYQWKRNGVNITTNGTSKTYKASSTGSYTCVASCIGTALTSNAIQVTSKTNAAASVSASGATSFCAGDSVTLNCTNLGSNYSVQWYRTNVSMENATAYSQVVKQPGTYKVVTKNLTNGCSRISGSSVVVAVNCRIAGDITSGTPAPLTESEAKFTANELSQGVNIFPNPNNGSFTFAYDGEEYGDAVLQVINSMGQMIYNTNVNVSEGGYTHELQLGDTATKGIYIVRLLINGNSYDSRVLVR
jgi:hypothetical protein